MSRWTRRFNTLTASSVGRAALVLFLSLGYLSYVFQLSRSSFWTSGIGGWLDPYFINFLLEHWHHSVISLSNPASPPMYFPVSGTLGYSHALILYVPIYVAVRLFLHPFQAYNVTLLLVLETGILSLHLLFRTFLRLSFIESVLLTAFFATSQNVINIGTSNWSQRASVFLIPPILLILLVSRRMRQRVPRLCLAWLSGLLCSLLLTQDFYTGLFAAVFGSLAVMTHLVIGRDPPVHETFVTFWKGERTSARVALVIAALGSVWALFIGMFHGFEVDIFGLKITSHDWRRPAVLALAALGVFRHLHGGIRTRARLLLLEPWLLSFAVGALAGGLVFLWIYLDAYRANPVFPEHQLMSSFVARDPSSWRGLSDVLNDLGAYDTRRPFAFVLVMAILAWVPYFRIDWRDLISWVSFAVISVFVLMISVRFDGFALWRFLLLDRLHGFSAIRDPKRMIYVYELALALATGVHLARLRAKHMARIVVSVVLLLLLVVSQNRETFEFLRPADIYDRWVAAPVDIDISCKSFFIRRGSDEYMSRSDHMWGLYAVDSMFVALNHSLPTLNGYSALAPKDWDLANPQEPGYSEAVASWIARHNLHGVCEFDIDRRAMRPYRPSSQ